VENPFPGLVAEGIAHRVCPCGIHLPWRLDAPLQGMVWPFAGDRLVLAVVLALLSLSGARRTGAAR
jgi:AGZA family xanthine/uracil permease-like MFS transporter